MNNRKNEIFIDDANIYLRPLHPEDVTAEYINGLNDPDVNRFLVSVRQHRQTKDSVTQYVQKDWNNPLSILFGIFIKEDGNALVGTVRVHNVDFFHFSASIGLCLFAKRVWKKGYACNALKLVKKYLFEELCLHYLEAGVYAENSNSINCFLKAGFVEQYRVKNKYRHINSFEDTVFFAAISSLFDMSLLK